MERLSAVKVGDPSSDKTQVGPLATAQQLADVRAGMERLAQGAEVALGGPGPVPGLERGYYVAPTLLVKRQAGPDDLVHRLEVFGPCATLLGYTDEAAMWGQVAAAGGGLVSSVYSDDKAFMTRALLELGPFHGRVCVANEKVAGQTVSPGTVMPGLLHGGPGRAGGGEELGGLRGLALYQQRVAFQAPRPVADALAEHERKAP